MEEKIKVMTLNMSETNVKIETVDNTLQSLQQAVDGNIEQVTLNRDIILWVNEEGKVHGYNFNFQLVNKFHQYVDDIVGNVIFTGHDEEGECSSLTEEDILWINAHFIDRRHFVFGVE
jgi:hypothetical protein